MKVVVDVNVVLDVFLARTDWLEESARVLDAAERKRIEAHLAGHTVTTVFYVTRVATDRRKAVAAVTDLLRICEVIPVEEGDFHRALTLDLPDFEDSVQVACALKVGADHLVTRDEELLGREEVSGIPPGALMALLGPREESGG